MRKDELSHHISTCLDRCSVNDTYVENDKIDSKFQIPVSTWTAPACDEDWDEEMDKNATIASSFFWGMSTSQLPQDRERNIKLTPGLRTPRVLPWKLGE